MCKAMIVDDSSIFRDAFKTELIRHIPWILVQEAKDGREAMEKIQRMLPSLIFVDMHLPGADGLQLAQKIKNEFPDIHIAMLTGYDFPQYRWAANQYGVERYFVKDSLDWKEVEDFVKIIPECNRLGQGQ
jgi:two-component system, response regulator YesN